jgi:hypothetical protein
MSTQALTSRSRRSTPTVVTRPPPPRHRNKPLHRVRCEAPSTKLQHSARTLRRALTAPTSPGSWSMTNSAWSSTGNREPGRVLTGQRPNRAARPSRTQSGRTRTRRRGRVPRLRRHGRASGARPPRRPHGYRGPTPCCHCSSVRPCLLGGHRALLTGLWEQVLLPTLVTEDITLILLGQSPWCGAYPGRGPTLL